MANLLKDQTDKALIAMSLPISIGMLSTFLFQVIDTYFVGQLGANALAALSFASTLYFLLVGLFIGLAVGISIIIGKAVGENNIGKVRTTSWLAILVCFLLTALLSFLCIVLANPIFQLLGASPEILVHIRAYIIPLLLGLPLLTVGIVCGSILRATGNVVQPEVLMAIAGVINLLFDYLLIFGHWGFPAMGIQGAAYATVLSWLFIIIGMAVLLIKDKLLAFTMQPTPTTNHFNIIKAIFRLGAPTILTQIIGPATIMYLTFLLARFASTAVAAFGVAGRIEMLLMIGILGVSTAITPFIAQNYGAKQQLRIDQAIAFGGRASTYLGIFMILILFIFIKPIAKLFSDNVEVIQYTSNYFYIVSISYIFYGLYLITTSIFNGLELPINSLKITLIKSLGFTMPLTLVGALWGIEGIFAGLALSNILGGIYAARQMRAALKTSQSSIAEVNIFEEYLKDFKAILNQLLRKG